MYMAFTTQTFLFIFLPITLAAYYICLLFQRKGFLSNILTRIRATDIVLILFSALFYAWACFDDMITLCLYVLAVYACGCLIEKSGKSGLGFLLGKKNAANEVSHLSFAIILLTVAVAGAAFYLVCAKYASMLNSVWSLFTQRTLSIPSVPALLGISFITFSAVSYLVDIYRGYATAGSLIDCMLYLLFFPKVISGPVVLWKEFQKDTVCPTVTLAGLSDGVQRIMIGCVKKLIFADTFGACIASIYGGIDVVTAWGIGILYMLQIYFDFSGYSDIAIGVSRMLGFSFKENFNFPYVSCSITEFWRRWHISLGSWFREYIYFPLGGNRKGKKRTLANIGVVFLLTGIWHGVGFKYLLWGAVNGLCNIIEKVIGDKKFYIRMPRLVKWFFTMAVTFLCWGAIFRSSPIDSVTWVKSLLGIDMPAYLAYTWQHYFDKQIITFVVIAFLGATVFGLPKVQQWYHRILETKIGYLIHTLVLVVLFVVAIMFMVNSQYSPFIYFQY